MGIFLTAEMTGGYQLFLPLLMVSTISYCTIRIFLKYSIYTMRLAKRGELLTHHKDKAVLTLLKMDSVIEKDFIEVHPEMSLSIKFPSQTETCFLSPTTTATCSASSF